ncbi:Nudix hydrolase 14, chloroplastic [Capsicum chinense]|nr:Nudix hydrolase 14, chloroplastic [Capsicum chinense]
MKLSGVKHVGLMAASFRFTICSWKRGCAFRWREHKIQHQILFNGARGSMLQAKLICLLSFCPEPGVYRKQPLYFGGSGMDCVPQSRTMWEYTRNAIESSLFKQWLKNIQTETGLLANGAMSLRQVLIQQDVDMFGKRLGFLKFKADIIDKETGQKVPGIVFARGPAVAVLILLDSEDETYAVLTEQVRVPVGRLILELPAGMLDDDQGDFAGTAVREVEEETGIHLNVHDMVDLTAFLDSSTGARVFPSPVSFLRLL